MKRALAVAVLLAMPALAAAEEKIDACSLLSAAEIQGVIGAAVEKGERHDSGKESNGAYSSSCVWMVSQEALNRRAAGKQFVILNAQRWPQGSEGARTFLDDFRKASDSGVLPKQLQARSGFGDEALWWGDGLAVRRRDVSFGVSVFVTAAAIEPGEREGRLAKTILARLDEQGGSAIQRGEYLVRAANCVSCHTLPGGQVFAGGVPFPTEFGVIYSTNITPDKATGIGTWTFEQFEAAVRHGVRPDGEHLYPAFPYTNFTKITDSDLHALYDYFMNLRPVTARAQMNEMKFPFSQRWLLGVWKAMFFDEGRFQPDPKQSAQWNRGAYLVQALAHCDACHSPRNMLGGVKTSAAFAGGVLNEMVEERGPVRRSAPNLTSSPHGLAAWSVDDLAGYLKLGVGSRARLMGTMNEVVLNSTRHLTDADTRAMAVYIKSLAAAGETGSRPSKATMELGAKQYDIHCGTCHLPTGKGSADTGPPLAGSAFAQAPDPSSLVDLVINGPRDPVPPPSGQWTRPWQVMTPFGQKLSDEQAAALLTFVRNSWGNAAGTVEPRDIDRMRY